MDAAAKIRAQMVGRAGPAALSMAKSADAANGSATQHSPKHRSQSASRLRRGPSAVIAESNSAPGDDERSAGSCPFRCNGGLGFGVQRAGPLSGRAGRLRAGLAGEATSRSRLLSGVLVLLALAGLAAASIASLSPPASSPPTRRPTEFSADRAFAHVERIGAQVHPAGSAAAGDVRTTSCRR